MSKFEELVTACAAIANYESASQSGEETAGEAQGIATWIERIRDLLAALDEETATKILAEVETAVTALAAGRYLLAILAVIRIMRAFSKLKTD